MTAALEKTTTPPIHEEADFNYYGEDRDPASSCGCGCFRLPWGYRRNGGEEAWLGRKLKEVKEFTEVVAGPKWKNMVRKVGGYFSGRQKQRFQYDAQSYALNFDAGGEDDGLLLNYSSRFSAPASRQ